MYMCIYIYVMECLLVAVLMGLFTSPVSLSHIYIYLEIQSPYNSSVFKVLTVFLDISMET